MIGNTNVRVAIRDGILARAVENYLTKITIIFYKGKIESTDLNDPDLEDLEGAIRKWEQEVDKKIVLVSEKLVGYHEKKSRKRRLSYTIEQFKGIVNLVNAAQFAENAEKYLSPKTFGPDRNQNKINFVDIK